MPQVYITNRGPYDYSDAERFGDLVFCTEGKIDKLDIAQMHRELSEAMEDSIPEDYILLTSLTSLCSVACAIFAAKHNCLNLLVFNDGAYVVKSIVLYNHTNTPNDTRRQRVRS